MDVTQEESEQDTESEIKITGYMTGDIFAEWLQRFQQSIVSKNPSRRILLLVDNASCHKKDIADKAHLFPNIRVLYLPPNSTSVTQPLDAGIIAVFKLRYRQVIGDKTTLLRITYDRNMKGRKGLPVNPWNIRLSNLEAWNSIVRAWSYVKPESVRNCYCHVPILCGEQKNQLRQFDEINSSDTIDPCVYEAIVSRRDIDNLIEEQDESGSESILNIPYQYTGMPSSSSLASSSEERSESYHAASARRILYNDAIPAIARSAEETLEQALGLRQRAGLVIETPETPEAMMPETRLASREAFISANSQRVIVSEEERNRATTIQAALDGAPSLCKLIEDYKGDESFMAYFKAPPVMKATALLGEEWLPSDDDLSDGDYSASTDGTESTNSADSTDETLDSDGTQEEVSDDSQGDADKADYSYAHSIFLHAARLIPNDQSDLRDQLELVADAGLGPEFFDADATYVSLFKEEQRKQGEMHRQRLIHSAQLKKKYPQVEFPLMTLGTIERPDEDMDMS
jgi:hypothetical protein